MIALTHEPLWHRRSGRARHRRGDAGAAAGRALDAEAAAERADAVGQTGAVRRLRAADTVVAHLDDRVSVLASNADPGAARVRVLGDVRECLGYDEVGS